MNDSASDIDATTLKIGLLMEGAQTHQQLAETHLEKLRVHTQDLDGVVREAIRRTLVEELGALTAECETAVRALRKIKQAVQMRGLALNMAIAVVCTAVPAAIVRYTLPSQADIAAMRKVRDSLAHEVAQLEQRGGKADWRNCGAAARLCVRIDKKAPVFGDQADYFIIEGY